MENKSKILNDRKLINNNQSLKSSGGENMKRNFFLFTIFLCLIMVFTANAEVKNSDTYVLLTIGEPDSLDPG